MSLDFTSSEITFSTQKLQEMVTAMDFPPYRSVFTTTKIGNLCYTDGTGHITEKVPAELEMPFMKMILLNEEKKTYMKYLDPLEFNVFIQEKFANWDT